MTRLRANALLLIAALIWGTTFVAQQVVLDNIGPFLYTGLRFLLGALIVLPMAVREYVRLKDRAVVLDRRDATYWCALGSLLFCGIILQQIGIGATTVTNAGFLTALYVPLVPLLAWIIHRQMPHLSTWPAVAACLGGTWLLAGGELSEFSEGDLWVIASTVFWGLHVLYVGRIAAHKGTPILVAFSQFVVCGVLALTWGLLTEPLSQAALIAALPAILYGGVLSVGVGFTLQVVAQRHTGAADAAILLSSETLFAGIAGAMVLGERLSFMQLSGCALIFTSILAVQLLPLWLERKAAAH